MDYLRNVKINSRFEFDKEINLEPFTISDIKLNNEKDLDDKEMPELKLHRMASNISH